MGGVGVPVPVCLSYGGFLIEGRFCVTVSLLRFVLGLRRSFWGAYPVTGGVESRIVGHASSVTPREGSIFCGVSFFVRLLSGVMGELRPLVAFFCRETRELVVLRCNTGPASGSALPTKTVAFVYRGDKAFVVVDADVRVGVRRSEVVVSP